MLATAARWWATAALLFATALLRATRAMRACLVLPVTVAMILAFFATVNRCWAAFLWCLTALLWWAATIACFLAVMSCNIPNQKKIQHFFCQCRLARLANRTPMTRSKMVALAIRQAVGDL